MRNRRVGEYALDVVLHESDRSGEDGGERSDDRDGLHRSRCEHEEGVRARHHVDACCHHRCGVDQGADWRRAFHRVRQPHIKRQLRRLAAGSDEQKQRSRGDDGIADRKVSGAGCSVDVDVAQRTHIPCDEEHAKDESRVADAVDDERLVRGIARRLALEIETDQQIRAQAHAFPADKHECVVVGEDECEHGEHEEVEISEEAVVAAFMSHVANGIDMDQHADAGDEQEPDAGEWVEQESGVGLEVGLRAVVCDVICVAGVGAEPGVENLLVGLVIVCVSPCVVLQHRAAGHDEGKDNHAHAHGADRLLGQPAAKEEHDRRAQGGQ